VRQPSSRTTNVPKVANDRPTKQPYTHIHIYTGEQSFQCANNFCTPQKICRTFVWGACQRGEHIYFTRFSWKLLAQMDNPQQVHVGFLYSTATEVTLNQDVIFNFFKSFCKTNLKFEHKTALLNSIALVIGSRFRRVIPLWICA